MCVRRKVSVRIHIHAINGFKHLATQHTNTNDLRKCVYGTGTVQNGRNIEKRSEKLTYCEKLSNVTVVVLWQNGTEQMDTRNAKRKAK